MKDFKFYRFLRGGTWIFIVVDLPGYICFWQRLKKDENIKDLKLPKPEIIREIEYYDKYDKRRLEIKKIIEELDR